MDKVNGKKSRKKAEPSHTITTRVPVDVAVRIGRVGAALQRGTPSGITLSASDVLRAVVLRGLAEMERGDVPIAVEVRA